MPAKVPYIDWANSLDEGSVKVGSKDMPDGNMYLVEDNAELELDLEGVLEPPYATIFEEALGGWHRLEADWPRHRDLVTFLPGLRWRCMARCSTWSAAGCAQGAQCGIRMRPQAARR